MNNLSQKESAQVLSTLIAPFINKEAFKANPEKELNRAFEAFQDSKYNDLSNELFKAFLKKDPAPEFTPQQIEALENEHEEKLRTEEGYYTNELNNFYNF